MSNHPSNPTRRKVLTTTTAVVAGVGKGTATTPFVQSMTPSAKARASGADVEVNIDYICLPPAPLGLPKQIHCYIVA